MFDKFKFTSIFHLFITISAGSLLCIASCSQPTPPATSQTTPPADSASFHIPDTSTIPHDQFGDAVRYGRELLLHTAQYLGPNGTVGHYLGNKMNCTNCHLDAGTRPYGLNFFSTHARYPQYRGRENAILTLAERVNNCVERPHNGTPLPLDSKEMVAMVCYMKWISQNVPVGHHVSGDDGIELKMPDRPASPQKGAEIFAARCASCHGKEGQGLMSPDSTTYTYPPLWGMDSYQAGSSMHRIIKAARFIKANMPDKQAKWNSPVLTDEEAIDVASFINDDSIHKRPSKKGAQWTDYTNVNVKPIDYDNGPFPDSFSVAQHKFGPYQPIIDYHKQHNLPVTF